MLRIALIFFGLALILRWFMINLRNFPVDTPKTHFSGFNFMFCLSQYVESFFEVSYMVSRFFQLGQHVIHIYLHSLSNLIAKKLLHQSLICGTGIFQSKRHHFRVIQTSVSDERGLCLVRWVYADLVVSRECVHKIKEFVSCCCIHELIDSGN